MIKKLAKSILTVFGIFCLAYSQVNAITADEIVYGSNWQIRYQIFNLFKIIIIPICVIISNIIIWKNKKLKKTNKVILTIVSILVGIGLYYFLDFMEYKDINV